MKSTAYLMGSFEFIQKVLIPKLSALYRRQINFQLICATMIWNAWRRLQWLSSLKGKLFFIISGHGPFMTLYISIINVCIVLRWIEIEQSLWSRFSVLKTIIILSLQINRRQRSCSLFNILFKSQLWNIEVTKQ